MSKEVNQFVLINDGVPLEIFDTVEDAQKAFSGNKLYWSQENDIHWTSRWNEEYMRKHSNIAPINLVSGWEIWRTPYTAKKKN